MAGKSQAIWINNDRNRGARDSTSSEGPFSPPAYSSSFGRGNLFGIQRSMSVASDGTAQNSPPNYPYANDVFESPYAARSRTRTYSFSGNSDEDPWSSGQMSTSAPGNASWRRSNSVCYSADKNLTRIDEHSAFPGFGNAIKKSMDKLFNPEMTRKMSFGPGGEIKKKNEQVKDRVVSMLTEGAFR